VTYATPQALRAALEHRLLAKSTATGVSLDRLRRRVVFERIVARLQVAEPGVWVLKGGMALEVRLGDAARLSKDIDVGLRDGVASADELRERLIEALSSDPDADGFVLAVGPVRRLAEDDERTLTWRVRVVADLAGRTFGVIQVDVSSRPQELEETEMISLPNSMDFAGISVPEIEIIDIHRHAAEKFHGMLRDVGERENTRVRDLVDLVILREHNLLEVRRLQPALSRVWAERNQSRPPARLPPLPRGWRTRYEHLAADHRLQAGAFAAANAAVAELWTETFPNQEI
jgi:predicted nucleotidyltransferase component of viral defense system